MKLNNVRGHAYCTGLNNYLSIPALLSLQKALHVYTKDIM